MDKRLEFWHRRHTEARTAVEVAEAHLLRIQAVGQLSLLAEQRTDPLAERRGEVVPLQREVTYFPPKPYIDDLIA